MNTDDRHKAKLAKAQRNADKRARKEQAKLAQQNEPIAETKLESPVRIAPIQNSKTTKKNKKASRKWFTFHLTMPKFTMWRKMFAGSGALWRWPITFLDGVIGSVGRRITDLYLSFLVLTDGVRSAPSRLSRMSAHLIESALTFTTGSDEFKRHAVGALIMIVGSILIFKLAGA